jgi:hypothetical protein
LYFRAAHEVVGLGAGAGEHYAASCAAAADDRVT